MLGAKKKLYGRNEKRPIEIPGENLNLHESLNPFEAFPFDFHWSMRRNIDLNARDLLKKLTTFKKISGDVEVQTTFSTIETELAQEMKDAEKIYALYASGDAEKNDVLHHWNQEDADVRIGKTVSVFIFQELGSDFVLTQVAFKNFYNYHHVTSNRH